MKKVILSAGVLLMLGFFVMPTKSFAQEKEISKIQIPQNVLKVFHKTYPKAKIKGTGIETENGHKYFEIESVEGEKHIDLLITHSGKITEVEETIPTGELPSSALNNLKAKFKSFKIEKAEKVTNGKKLTYELAIESNHKDYEIVLNSTGKIMKTKMMSKKIENNESGENGETDENDNN